MKVRLMEKKDINEIGRIMRAIYTEKYIKSDYEKEFLKKIKSNQVNRPTYLIAEEKGKIYGLSAFGQSWMNWRIYEIFNVGVDPAHQGKKIGTLLMNETIRHITTLKGRGREAFLILLTTPLPKWYTKKFGFKTLIRFRKKEARLMVLDVEKK